MISTIQVRMCVPAEFDARFVSAWADLERRAVESNAYMSRHFVLPALQHLDRQSEVVALLVERIASGSRELVGLGLFTPINRVQRFPMPFLRTYRSRHSYLGGPLLDRDAAAPAAQALLEFLRSSRSCWHGMEVSHLPGDGATRKALHAAALTIRASWRERCRFERAMLVPNAVGEQHLNSVLTPGRLKDLRRRRRRLDELGSVRWRALAGEDVNQACIDRFLHLEHRGWKGANGSSLMSRPQDEQFFRKMIENFSSTGSALFTELTLNDQVIASTSNLIAGNGGFAFKLGWNPEYERMSPGLLNEIELVRHAPLVFAGLDHVDSGAVEGSFLEELWSDRRSVVDDLYAVTPLAAAVLTGIAGLRGIRNWVRDRGVLPAREG